MRLMGFILLQHPKKKRKPTYITVSLKFKVVCMQGECYLCGLKNWV